MAISRVASNAARHAGQAGRAAVAQALVAGRAAQSVGVAAAREAARINSYIAPSIVLSAADAGDGTATIHVAAHNRIYPVQGNIKVDDVAIEAADVLAAPPGKLKLFVYYIDVTMADTTPAFLFTENELQATNGAAAGLHFVGVVPTPAAGAVATTGTDGAGPTGWPDREPITHNTF